MAEGLAVVEEDADDDKDEDEDVAERVEVCKVAVVDGLAAGCDATA